MNARVHIQVLVPSVRRFTRARKAVIAVLPERPAVTGGKLDLHPTDPDAFLYRGPCLLARLG